MITALIKLFFKLFFFTGRIGTRSAFLKPLKPEEEKEYFERIKDGDTQAEEELVSHNLRLVAHIAKKYKNIGYDTDELISIGSLGLLKAIRSYNLEHGNNFSTYASRCITNEILMLIRSDKKRQGDISLDTEIATDKDGNSVTIKEILPLPGDSIEEQTETKVLAENILNIMKNYLSKREYTVMTLRYGLDGNIPKTQEEIAKMLQISRSYISRIEKHSIDIIKGKIKGYT